MAQGCDPEACNDHGYDAIREFNCWVGLTSWKNDDMAHLLHWLICQQDYFHLDLVDPDSPYPNITHYIHYLWDEDTTKAVLNKLITNGLDVNISIYHNSSISYTLLYQASERGQLHLVRQLLEHGASVNILESGLLNSSLYCRENIEVIKILMRAIPNFSPWIFDAGEAICTAIRNEDASMVEFLINSGVDVDPPLYSDYYHRHPLSCAIESNSVAIVDMLLRAGANVVCLKDPLIGNRNTDIFARLIEVGVDVNSRTGYWSPLCYAACHTSIKHVKLLLEGGSDVESSCSDHRTALSFAVRSGEIQMVNILLEAGAVLNNDMLLEAKEHGHDAVFNFLDSFDSEHRKRTEDKKTILAFSTSPNEEAVETHAICLDFWDFRYFSRCKSDFCYRIELFGTTPSPLALACFLGKTDTVRRLIGAGVDVNRTEICKGHCHGMTPLNVAIRFKFPDIIDVLLDAGVTLENTDITGKTALGNALTPGGRFRRECHSTLRYNGYGMCPEIVNSLLKAGAKVDSRDEYGSTPLGLAIETSRDILRAILDAGADVNLLSHVRFRRATPHGPRISDWATPLEIAAHWCDKLSMEILLEYGADWRQIRGEKAIALSHPALLRHWFSHSSPSVRNDIYELDLETDYEGEIILRSFVL